MNITRYNNIKKVKEYILVNGYSNLEIMTKDLGISKPTISKIVTYLKDKGEI